MIIVGLAAIGATVVVALLVGFAYLGACRNPPALRDLAFWAGQLWVINFILDLLILYFAMPALTGPYGGWQWVLWPLLLTGIFALFGGSVTRVRASVQALNDRLNNGGASISSFSAYRTGRRTTGAKAGGKPGAGRVVNSQAGRGGVASSVFAGACAIGLVLIVGALVNGLIVASTTWFDPNAKALAAIPHIIVEPVSQALPPTNVDHIVLVTQGIASYLGQQALASGGQNYGSTYHTDPTAYTLQSVRGHLYWIAPLVYNNVWANLGNWQSPGYVVVDAEDPSVQATLRTGYHMRYLPAALFNQDLLHHVYLSGYTYGNLEDPTLEVDDSWRPYFTISLMQPTRGFTGDVVSRVLLVDAQTGAIGAYAVKDVPNWVDRIIPASAVNDYLTNWGLYHSAPWIDPSGAGQQKPATDTPQLVYNQVNQPVWLEPMTSSASTDNSSTGVVLYDTRDMTGRFYPLTGLGVTDNVQTTFQGNPANIRGYTVDNAQLYEIYNEPTWVCSFVLKNAYGEGFEAVGIVDARHLNGANVIMASTKAQALAGYAQWLADHATPGTGPTPSGNQVTIKGQVTRVSATTNSGTTVYYLLIAGQSRIFTAGLALSPELPLVQPGDTVQLSFLDTGQNVVTLTAFSDLSLPLGSPTPGVTPGATVTPTP
ncbi:MAG TPA: hypothetical protein VMV29_22265 [Ktedonobacterales bacterium]|nr:hypothetical protein [Ktedonobacterales bacterium]